MADIRMNEPYHMEDDKMNKDNWKLSATITGAVDDVIKNMFEDLAVVKFNMTEEAFLSFWKQFYPKHIYGGYNIDQWMLWQTKPFAFVAKWPNFCAWLCHEFKYN
jgi:hypothetical protein